MDSSLHCGSHIKPEKIEELIIIALHCIISPNCVIFLTIPFLILVCIPLCDACVCVVDAYVCRGWRLMTSVFLSLALPNILIQDLFLNLALVIWLDGLASQPQGPSIQCLLGARVIGLAFVLFWFLVGLEIKLSPRLHSKHFLVEPPPSFF